MQRDFELIRYVLKAIAQNAHHCTLKAHSFAAYPAKVVNYHLWLLIDAGLITGSCNHQTPEDGHFVCQTQALTWAGHEFLALIDEPSHFARIQCLLQERGLPLSFASIHKVAL